jgi:hypothetical protein
VKQKTQDSSLDLFLILGLTTFSFFITSALFLKQHVLYWDTGRLFSIFRDNLHSLNFFGEIAWWFPHAQGGTPAYYTSILNTSSCTSPLFVLVGLFCWALGKCHIVLTRYQPLYVMYYGWFQPTLFVVAVHCLSRQFFSSRPVRIFILVIAAFSPGVLFNVSDIGFLEVNAYGILFLAAYLHFLEQKAKGFAYLSVTLVLLALCLNNAVLYWNLFGLPLIVLSLSCFSSRQRGKVQRAVKSVSIPQWIGLGAGMLVAALPNFLTLAQGRDLVRSSMNGSAHYPFEYLNAGNPLEMFAVSLPGFGFDWTGRLNFSLMPMGPDHHVAYGYLGLLALPLFLLGLWRAPRSFRGPLLFLIATVFGALCLSAYSPWMGLVQWPESPLRDVNHYSDAAFKAGSFMIVLWIQALGFRAVLKGKGRAGVFLFALSSIGTAACFFVFLGKGIFQSTQFGVWALFSLLFLTALHWLADSPSRSEIRTAAFLLIGLTLAELSTHAFFYVRNIAKANFLLGSGTPALVYIDETAASDHIGMKNGPWVHYYMNHFLVYRSLLEMWKEGWDPGKLPAFGLFSAAHLDEGAVKEKQKQGNSSYENSLPLTSSENATNFPRSSPKPSSSLGEVVSVHRTYNRWDLKVNARQDALLFLRDAYSPYWKATGNGISVRVFKAFHNFKAVGVSRGVTEVQLVFEPPAIAGSIALAYACLFFFVLKCLPGDVFIAVWQGFFFRKFRWSAR